MNTSAGKPPLSVLYLNPSGQVGGAERSLLSLIARLDRAHYAPRAVIGSPGPLSAMLAEAGVPCEVVTMPPAMRRYSGFHPNPGLRAKLAPWSHLPAYSRSLARAAGAAHPALIHSNGLKMHLLGAWLKPRWRAPLIWHLRDFPPRHGGCLLRLLCRRADRIIANSRATADAYAARFPAMGPRLRVVYNGVDVAAFQNASGRDLRRRWNIPPSAVVIGMVAIFAPWKGHEVFLRAARQALAQDASLRFLLVGDDIYDTAGHGERRRELEGMKRDLGLGDTVHFTGFLAGDVAAAYAAMDIAVHASTQAEPFGRTLIEAMAAGTALITTGLGGSGEIAQNEREALFTAAGDAEALAAAMLRLARDRTERARLAANGRRRVRAEFSDGAHTRAVEAIYRELVTPAPH